MKLGEVFSLKSNMKFFSDNVNIIVLVILIALLAGYVFNNKQENFYTGDYEFVIYYTTWCGYSTRALEGEGGNKGFNALGSSYTTKDGKVVSIRKVDCDSSAGKTECRSQDVRGYPTIKLFKKNSPSSTKVYEGQRFTNIMKTYLDNHAK